MGNWKKSQKQEINSPSKDKKNKASCLFAVSLSELENGPKEAPHRNITGARYENCEWGRNVHLSIIRCTHLSVHITLAWAREILQPRPGLARCQEFDFMWSHSLFFILPLSRKNLCNVCFRDYIFDINRATSHPREEKQSKYTSITNHSTSTLESNFTQSVVLSKRHESQNRKINTFLLN